jgi:uncharacterized membrane protein
MVYLLAITSAVLYGAADFTGGLTTRRASTIPVVFISQASGLVFLALSMPVLPSATASRADLLWGVASALTGGIGVSLLYRALAIGAMAVVAPTTAVCAVAIPVVFSVFLGERLLPLAAAGIGLGMASIVLVSQQTAALEGEGLEKRSSGVGIALVSGVMIGFFFLCLAQTRTEAGMWPLLVARGVSVIMFGGVVLVTKQSIRMSGRLVFLASLCGLLDMLANALYLVAAREGPLSLVVTLSSLYPASTVLLARVVLRERLNFLQLSGVGCALAAIVLIVRGS